ncbi:UDP-N-acetylglucosamine--N-acetylmuramyl-(pentapeptide) pyrophosphoryl-undecaprenol N-acetylglucosamine transferase [Labeo rohita]|uniref:UDP-N-acetylglucosamine--N-acetylmuramyl-(Pentapeptide) pyrophosphoryl-undecaprenol N-acetylglucosamine transferase n=1 Tax=Labeo rohita TaxID=84645 RepID=A0ABQ8L720_LABRO|nr:UDP-N-acetylglucosamine--N-acetylmuramyl-(pentapeptide) pyrophosphoryl-undecaprenol N-acetylglucosamine transferase [Labeo rohita]
MKTLFLLALAFTKRVDESCLEFGPADSQVTLRPRLGYVPKVPTTPFRDQVVSLQALPPEEADPALALLVLGQQKGNAISKQRMAHWIVAAITLAYQAQGVPCPLRLRTHST